MNGISTGKVVHSVVFSSDGKYMVVGSNFKPFLEVYKLERKDTFYRLPNPDVSPSGTVYAAAFSPCSNYLAVGYNDRPYLSVYKRSDDVFTKLYDIHENQQGSVRHVTSVSFYLDGSDLMLVAVFLCSLGSETRFYKIEDNKAVDALDSSVSFKYYGEAFWL